MWLNNGWPHPVPLSCSAESIFIFPSSIACYSSGTALAGIGISKGIVRVLLRLYGFFSWMWRTHKPYAFLLAPLKEKKKHSKKNVVFHELYLLCCFCPVLACNVAFWMQHSFVHWCVDAIFVADALQLPKGKLHKTPGQPNDTKVRLSLCPTRPYLRVLRSTCTVPFLAFCSI